MSQLRTLRARLSRIMLVISGLTAAATFATVAMLSVRTSARHLAAMQTHIEQGIASQGKVLTENHALALRGLVLDNAFSDIQRLVDRAVREDPDLVYGLFVSSEGKALAFSRTGAARRADEPPVGDAIEQLGLTASELSVDRLLVHRVHRLGRDVLEVAVPVATDDGESLGTIRYGLSIERMREALSRAQRDRNTDLLQSVLWIAALVGLTTLIGLLSSRRQAFRITRPVEDLTQAARALAAGDRSVRVRIASGDELELLGSSFNHMVEELVRSYVALEQMNRTLEQKVEARTAELALKNRDMRLVLDNVDHGFLTLHRDGQIAGGRSRVVDEWFGCCESAPCFWQYIGETSTSFAQSFEAAWSQVTEGWLPLELALDQLPQRLSAGARTWSFRYLPILNQDELEGVLVVAMEITERLAREQKEQEQRELMSCFSHILRDPSGFSSFAREAEQMVRTITGGGESSQDATELARTLHTLKGNAGVMGLDGLASLCHGIEEQLASGEGPSPQSLSALSERWARLRAQVAELAGDASARKIEISPDEHAALVRRLSRDPDSADLAVEVSRWALEPAERPLRRLAAQAQALGRRLGKGELDVRVHADGVRLDPDAWAPLFAQLVHLVRNAVDHGIEPCECREQLGKPPRGVLTLTSKLGDGRLLFEVSDDGQGIDWSLVRQKARARGLPCDTSEQLLAVLLHDGFSTRTEVTETSGRGVGMGSLRHWVSARGGRIDVTSSPSGTCWILSFPFAANASLPELEQQPVPPASEVNQRATA